MIICVLVFTVFCVVGTVFCMVSFMYIYSFFCTSVKHYCHQVTTQLQLVIIIIINQSHYRPEEPRGFQELKVPRLRDNDTGWW